MKDKLSDLLARIEENGYIREITGFLYLPIAMIYLEMIAKQKIFGDVFDDKYVYLMFL